MSKQCRGVTVEIKKLEQSIFAFKNLNVIGVKLTTALIVDRNMTTRLNPLK